MGVADRADPAYLHPPMRPSTLVVGLALTAALALVALPGLTGSRAPRPSEPVPVGALQPLPDSGSGSRHAIAGRRPRRVASSAEGAVPLDATFIEPGEAPKSGPTTRAQGRPARRHAAIGPQAAEVQAHGHGHVLLGRDDGDAPAAGHGRHHLRRRRLRRAGHQRLRPAQGSDRIVDLYKPDFFDICGCPSWSGTTDGDGLRLLTLADRRSPGAVPARYPSGDPSACGPVRPPTRPSEAGKER